MPAGGERDDLDGDLGLSGGLDQVLELGTHDLMAADRAAQHGLIQHDPALRRIRPAERLLAGEAQRYGPFGEIIGRGREAGYGDGPDVTLGLQQPGHDLRFVGTDQGG